MLRKHIQFIAITLLSMLLIACSKSSDHSSVAPTKTSDSVSMTEKLSGTVVFNVNGYTLKTNSIENNDYALIPFNYVYFTDDGLVADIGLIDINTEEYPIAETMHDGQGAFALPGLIDAHGHVLGLGKMMQEVDLSEAQSLDEALNQIKAYAERNPHLKWIEGRGWNQTRWPSNAFPTAADLDKVVSDRPVALNRVDGHAVWVNSKAIELAQIDNDTPDPQGGKILRDEDGVATGILVDTAESYVIKHIPKADRDLIKEQLMLSMNELARLGMTAVHDAGVGINDLEAYIELSELKAENKIPIRIYAMLSGMETLALVDKPYKTNDERLMVESVKLYSDGALGSRGAALLEAYSDEPDNSGLLFNPEATYVEYLSEGRRKGFQMNTHAIGDRGNRIMLNAYEKAGAKASERHRIEHSQVVHLRDIPRFKELGIIPSMQATHATSDKNMAGARLGYLRLRGAYAWQKFLQQGSRIANGSDFPVERPHIFEGLYAAVSRRDRLGEPEGGWIPEDKMSRIEALKSFTIDAAYAAHMDDTTGSLEPGKWADFILVDKDFFECDEDEIKNIQVIETWVGGERVY